MQKSQLRIVFDTNVLYTGSASDLVRQEAASLIKENIFPDLEIHWYLPEIVRHERQYQMQRRALELLPAVTKLEKLLGHNLAFTEEILIDSVEKVVRQQQEELGFVNLALDCSKVDWPRVALDATYRRPPFQAGETEKGFRDCMIVECFLQLVADSPKTAKVCRVVLITNDRLVTEAVQSRTIESTNISVFSNLEELKGLINTLVSQVDEAFLASLRPKASGLFFVPSDKSSLFYKENVRQRVTEKFAAELSTLPAGATNRSNGGWRISGPNFVKKNGQRIQWASGISIDSEASKMVTQSPSIESSVEMMTPNLNVSNIWAADPSQPVPLSNLLQLGNVGYASLMPGIASIGSIAGLNSWANAGRTSTITTHKGTAVFEVLWSVHVTTKGELRKATVDEVRHLETTWEQVS